MLSELSVDAFRKTCSSTSPFIKIKIMKLLAKHDQKFIYHSTHAECHIKLNHSNKPCPCNITFQFNYDGFCWDFNIHLVNHYTLKKNYEMHGWLIIGYYKIFVIIDVEYNKIMVVVVHGWLSVHIFCMSGEADIIF